MEEPRASWCNYLTQGTNLRTKLLELSPKTVISTELSVTCQNIHGSVQDKPFDIALEAKHFAADVVLLQETHAREEEIPLCLDPILRKKVLVFHASLSKNERVEKWKKNKRDRCIGGEGAFL